ncbi:MAG: PaaI family thioesterase [Thermodesulfobacteriota bacterium]|nr:PaaI family thioesterase [Thermodesulfobacteriota bacterium]
MINRLADDKYCFACGPHNPIGLRMEVIYGESKAMSRLSLKREFQGWEDIVHGGVVATVLDEIMAHAVMHYVGKAVTTSLQITYRVPLHVGQEIQAEGYVIQKKSRGAVARGEIRGVENGKVIATAESRLVFLP